MPSPLPRVPAMPDPIRIALIHATRVAIDPIETAAKELWPEAETVTILEEGLSIDRAKSRELTSGLRDRIVGLSKYAEGLGSDGVLFTCSAFGQAIEDAADTSAVPVMKPNEAMFAEAFEYGNRAVMIYTFKPSASGMEDEFRNVSTSLRSSATIRSIYCDGALAAKRGGDEATHNRLIAETAATIEDADVILLAQFSMASAAADVRTRTNTPVLTSPESAIREMKRRINEKTIG